MEGNSRSAQALLQSLGNLGRVRMKAWQVYLFTVHLHAMLRCGMPLIQGLDVLARSGPLATQRASRRLLKDVECGLRFSQALSRQPESFATGYVRIIQTAEETGKLVECLDRLSQTLDRQNQTVRRLFSALIYPSFLLAASVAMVTAMIYLVFPMIVRVTADAGVHPPALTRALIWLSQPWVLIVLACAVVALLAAAQFALRQPALRRLSEEHFPPMQFYVQVQVLRSIRQLALMLESGVDLLRSLVHGGQVGDGSLLVREAYAEILRKTRAGEALPRCFAEQSVFPRTLTGMLSVCDETGQTAPMLHRFCDMLEESLNSRIDIVTALLEPIMLGLMGFVIGLILIAAFLPIYQLIGL